MKTTFEENILAVWDAKDDGTLDALMREWKIEELESRLHGHLNDLSSAQSSIDDCRSQIKQLKKLP